MIVLNDHENACKIVPFVIDATVSLTCFEDASRLILLEGIATGVLTFEVLLEETSLEDVSLEEAALEEVSLEEATLEEVVLEEAALEEAALEEVVLEEVVLEPLEVLETVSNGWLSLLQPVKTRAIDNAKITAELRRNKSDILNSSCLNSNTGQYRNP